MIFAPTGLQAFALDAYFQAVFPLQQVVGDLAVRSPWCWELVSS